MSSNVTTSESALPVGQAKATLLEMRADPQAFPRLKTYSREQAVLEMTKVVSMAFLYRGQASDLANIQFISSTLVDELLEDRQYGAANLSFGEIQVVVKRAVLGGSEMFGISVASLYKVIMDFVKGEGNRNQKEIAGMKRKEEGKGSAVSPIIRAYTGEMLRNNKVNKNNGK